MEAAIKGEIKKTFTVRCPKCKNVMLASATSTNFDKERKKEIMTLIEEGYSSQTEDWEVGVGLP